MQKAVLLTVIALAVSACAGGDRGLRDLRSNGGGPDEFQVNPVNPLVIPDSFGALPPPTPGGSNRVDPNPQGDAVLALGGNPGALVPAGIPASDSAIVAAARRGGVDPAIRQTLAAEDAAFRNRAARLSLFGGRDRYFSAYARQALDAYAELTRFRNAGVATPTAPPQ